MINQRQNNTLIITVSIIYLFFNSFLLPDGLLYTTLLTPFFFINLLKGKGMMVYLGFLLFTVVMAILQYPSVEHFKDYIQSFLLLQCTAIFVINAFFVIKDWYRPEETFKITGTVNMALLMISMLALFLPFLRHYFWYEMSISEGLPVIPRLKMLTYEASYYSLIIIPVFAYYFLKKMLLKSKVGILLVTLIISLILSFSFGVLAGLLVSILLVYLFNLNELGRKINLNYLSFSLVILLITVIALYKLYPHNLVFDRIRNIYEGKDTSARGRTYESFILAWDIAKLKSVYIGVGLGQLKTLGRDYIIQFYSYSNIPPVARIPNAVAETINIYGITGLVIRFFIIIYLFFKTRVWDNYYRMLLFIFVFIYQFTGSFLFNVAEYIIWVLAFSAGIFPVFERKYFLKNSR